MRMWNTNICLTSKLSIKVILLIICSILLLAFSYSNSPPTNETVFIDLEEEPWRPSEEDIAYQDSMYVIIEQTQLDIDDIKFSIDGILYKLDRLYYEDGSWDSIRYVDGGAIDNRIN